MAIFKTFASHCDSRIAEWDKAYQAKAKLAEHTRRVSYQEALMALDKRVQKLKPVDLAAWDKVLQME